MPKKLPDDSDGFAKPKLKGFGLADAVEASPDLLVGGSLLPNVKAGCVVALLGEGGSAVPKVPEDAEPKNELDDELEDDVPPEPNVNADFSGAGGAEPPAVFPTEDPEPNMKLGVAFDFDFSSEVSLFSAPAGLEDPKVEEEG